MMKNFLKSIEKHKKKFDRSRAGSTAGAGILTIVITVVIAAIAAGVGVAVIGTASTGILATGSSGDLNLTGLVRTIVQLSPLVIALAVAIAMFRALEGLADRR